MRGISIFWLTAWLLWPQSSALEDGIAAFHRGDYQGARRLLSQSAGRPQADLFLALTDAATGRCDAAIPALAKSFEARQDRRIAGLALAQCRLAARNFTAAGDLVTRLLRDFPSDPDVLYIAANYHMKAWNDVILRLYRDAPSSFRVDQLSAEVFETQGKFPEAVSEYRKAIAANPRAIDLHYSLGRALLQQSHDPANLDQARKAFEAELELNPSDAAAEYQLGQILLLTQKKNEASERFEKALQLRPDFPEPLIAVAKLRLETKRYDDAIRLLEHAIHLQPLNETAHYNLMLAFRQTGRTSDAQREKAELDRLQKPPDGEFTNFLKRLGKPSEPRQ